MLHYILYCPMYLYMGLLVVCHYFGLSWEHLRQALATAVIIRSVFWLFKRRSTAATVSAQAAGIAEGFEHLQ